MNQPSLDAPKLFDDIVAHLPEDARVAIESIAKAGGSDGVYIAGGAVRDSLLGRQVADVDLVTIGDAIEIARAAWSGRKLTTHARFRTVSARIDGIRVDVATARSETYARPGALPRIAPASIEDDLGRRDFTVNALALRIDGAPELIDPSGGMADIGAGLLRVLHDFSFRDDATRIFRALRYASGLGFGVEAHTNALLTQGLRYVDAIGGERLRRELELSLEEETAGVTLEVCQERGVLQAVHPALHWNSDKTRAWRSDAASHAQALPFGFALLAAGASEGQAAEICARLRLRRHEAAAVTALASMQRVAEVLRRPEAKPSGVAQVLDRYPPAATAAFAMTTRSTIAAQLALRYLGEWRRVKPLLRGDELISMGVPEGPQVERGLQLLRAARLDGWASDRGDEQALVLRYAKSIHDSGQMTSIIELEPDNA